MDTIWSPFPHEADRTFRYAPRSSGLEIVRKSLGHRNYPVNGHTNFIDGSARGVVPPTNVLDAAGVACVELLAQDPERLGVEGDDLPGCLDLAPQGRLLDRGNHHIGRERQIG